MSGSKERNTSKSDDSPKKSWRLKRGERLVGSVHQALARAIQLEAGKKIIHVDSQHSIEL